MPPLLPNSHLTETEKLARTANTAIRVWLTIIGVMVGIMFLVLLLFVGGCALVLGGAASEMEKINKEVQKSQKKMLLPPR